MKINNQHAFEMNMVDGAYVNTLVDFINACRAQGVEIDKVNTFQNGWLITFEGFNGDAICHDGSYGSPCYYGDMTDAHKNDWSRTGEWETIGFPWDGDDVSVHTSGELAFYLHCLKLGLAPWDNEDC